MEEGKSGGNGEEWVVPASEMSLRCSNPIRQIVDKIEMPKNAARPVIALSIGDPTVYGNLPTPSHASEALMATLSGAKHNGYLPSSGGVEAREAVAAYSSVDGFPPLSAADVVIGSGCSHALFMAICTLAPAGKKLLIPAPGFSLYQTLCEYFGITYVHYPLLPHQEWQVDLQRLEELVDEDVAALLVNNPSNPCGSNYSVQHLRDIVAVAEKHRLPIIADEIYANMVFEGETFTPMAAVSKEVPILSCGGLAKRFMMPGWRVGWVCIHDRKQRFAHVRDGLLRVSTTILGACSLIQGLIPKLLEETSDNYFKGTMATLEQNARFFAAGASKIPGLRVVKPQGAMYMMLGLDVDSFDDTVSDDVHFATHLLAEVQVFVLPGSCFKLANFFRVVICAPKEQLADALGRLQEFFNAHRKDKSLNTSFDFKA